MRKVQWLLPAIFVFSALTVFAQEKFLTIDDIFDPERRVAFGGKPLFVEWNNDGTLRQFRVDTALGNQLVRVNALTGEATPFLDKSRLEAALVPAGIKPDTAKLLANQPLFVFSRTENSAVFSSDADLFFYDFQSGKARRLTNTPTVEELEADFSPDGRMVSFVRGNNLFVINLATGRETQLTRDGSAQVLNGYLDWVYEEELYGRGQKRGYWWSPDSTSIAFLRFDEKPVPKFVLTNDIVTDQIVENTDYPQAGDPNPLVKLGSVNVKTRLVRFVNTSKYKPEDFLISRVAWTPDSRSIIWQAQNREQTFLDLNSADKTTGATRTLLRETTAAWVLAIDNPTFLKDGSMIWQSERNGFHRLFHIDKNGKVIRQIVDGSWETNTYYGFDETTGYVYFSANGEDNNWIDTHVYRVKLDGTGFERLTKEAGTHTASFNPAFTHFVDNWSDANTPVQTRLYRADGTLERVLNENKVDVLSEYKLGKTQFLKIKTRDNFEMEAMMILPPDFNVNRKYPVLSYTYSGPHAPSVRNRWGGNRFMWHQMMAQKGYIIWICDNRTSSGKGVNTAWKAYKDLGRLETEDLEDGFNYLKSLAFVDGSRLGLWGWSYGGYMTSYFMTHSKTLKAGVAGGLVGDWSLYDSIYTERVMLTPQNNPQGYARSSVLKAAKDLSGRLLIIHGAMDENVHMQNATQLIYELQKAGKQFDLMIYPTQRHGVTDAHQAKHMYQMMTDFFLKNL